MPRSSRGMTANIYRSANASLTPSAARRCERMAKAGSKDSSLLEPIASNNTVVVPAKPTGPALWRVPTQ